jgi:AraC-like DNA-binding protein
MKGHEGMEMEIKLPWHILLPGMEVLLTGRFFHGLKNRPPMLHTHPCFELTCVEEGENARLILVPPLVPHMAAAGHPDRISSILFSFQAAQEKQEDVCDVFRSMRKPIEMTDSFDGAKRLHAIKEAVGDPRPGLREQVEAELRLLFVHLARSLYPADQKKPVPLQTLDEERLGLLEECFNVDFRDPTCSKSKLAQRIGVSERQLSRILAEKYHSSFSALLLRTRMNLAQAMLQHGGSTKAEIAAAVGYTSLPSFRRAYKAYFGHSLPRK